MESRVALWGLSLLPVFFAQGLAQADQLFPSTTQKQSFTSCRVGVGCAHFEGYIVIPRHLGAPSATPQAAVRPAAVLSANRLYLSREDDKTP